MTALRERRTKLTFETASELRDGRRYRPIVIEAEPEFAVVRLKGTRQRLTVTWEAIAHLAYKMEAAKVRSEKQRQKGAK
jgi:hypothetical protein